MSNREISFTRFLEMFKFANDLTNEQINDYLLNNHLLIKQLYEITNKYNITQLQFNKLFFLQASKDNNYLVKMMNIVDMMPLDEEVIKKNLRKRKQIPFIDPEFNSENIINKVKKPDLHENINQEKSFNLELAKYNGIILARRLDSKSKPYENMKIIYDTFIKDAHLVSDQYENYLRKLLIDESAYGFKTLQYLNNAGKDFEFLKGNYEACDYDLDRFKNTLDLMYDHRNGVNNLVIYEDNLKLKKPFVPYDNRSKPENQIYTLKRKQIVQELLTEVDKRMVYVKKR